MEFNQISWEPKVVLMGHVIGIQSFLCGAGGATVSCVLIAILRWVASHLGVFLLKRNQEQQCILFFRNMPSRIKILESCIKMSCSLPLLLIIRPWYRMRVCWIDSLRFICSLLISICVCYMQIQQKRILNIGKVMNELQSNKKIAFVKCRATNLWLTSELYLYSCSSSRTPLKMTTQW